MMRRIKRLLPILIPLLCAILVVLLFRTVFFLGYVPTTSMEPTIPKGSLILGLRQFGELTTGDIVIFRHEGQTLVKRIAACPGETCILNGSPITVPPSWATMPMPPTMPATGRIHSPRKPISSPSCHRKSYPLREV